jgi:isoquinoline 1-oxidoreductase alpha subunit
MPLTLDLKINGATHNVASDPDRPLLTVLRDELDLTGTKYGCGEGQCGACTVLIDGQPRRSCITELSSIGAKEITTIEGLAKDGHLHPVQQAFLDAQAFQCAYCTPGMIMSSVALLEVNKSPGDEEIVRHMQGNVCRCGTYPRIVAAIRAAAKMRSGS